MREYRDFFSRGLVMQSSNSYNSIYFWPLPRCIAGGTKRMQQLNNFISFLSIFLFFRMCVSLNVYPLWIDKIVHKQIASTLRKSENLKREISSSKPIKWLVKCEQVKMIVFKQRDSSFIFACNFNQKE